MTDERLTDIYNRANNVTRKRIPLSTESVFKAMRLAMQEERERHETLIAAIEKSVKQNMSSWGEWVRDQINEFRAAQGKDSAST